MKKLIQRIGKMVLFFSLIFCLAQNQSSDIERLKDELESGPDHGYALLGRVKNNSEESAGLLFEKKRHDDLPNQTFVRIKSLDPELGKEGKYFTVSKDSANRFTMNPTTTNSKKASTFIIARRMSKNLHDWLGISSPDANNAFMRFDKETKDVVFDAKDSTFTDEDNYDCHWEIPEDVTIDNAVLKNRKTNGCLYPFKGEKSVKIKEEKIMSNDVWGIKSDYNDVLKVKIDMDGTRPIKFGDKVSIAFSGTIGFNGHIAEKAQVILTSKDTGRRQMAYVTITDENGNDSRQNLTYGTSFRIRFSDGLVLHAYPSDLGPLAQNERKIIDKKYIATQQGGAINLAQNVQYGDLIAIKSVGDQKFIRQEKGFPAGVNQGDGQIRTYFMMLSPTGPGGMLLNGIFDRYDQVKIKSALYSNIHEKPQETSTIISQVAVIDATRAWGVDVNGNLYKYSKIGNPAWEKYQTSGLFDSVTANQDDLVFLISKEKTIFELSKQGKLIPIKLPDMSKGMRQLAIVSKTEVWGLNTEGIVSRYDGLSWDTRKILDKKAESITALGDGTIRAVDTNGDIWEYNSEEKRWESIGRPGNTKIIRLSGNYAISDAKSGNVYKWDDATDKWVGPLFNNTHYDDIAVANGYQIKQEFKMVNVECASTVIPSATPPDQPFPVNEKAKIAFEIVKIGMGGGIPGNGGAFSFEAMPLIKKPTVFGIAKNKKPPLVPGVPFTIPPMKGRGGAWFESAFPGDASFGVIAMPGDKGGLHIKLGDQISDTFLYDIVIGGALNTKASIIKRNFEGKEPQDIAVFECSAKQSRFAKMLAGEPNPYWISYNDGLILAGMGEIGENPFMAWRDPNPTSEPTRLAIGSETQEFACVYPKLSEPIVAKKPNRNYQTFPSAPSTAIPFRFPNHGSLTFQAKGKNSITATLQTNNDPTKEAYFINFSATEPAGIFIKKNAQIGGKYEIISCANILAAKYPACKLSETDVNQFWISYDDGQILIGQGTLGENILLMYQDITPADNINAIKFELNNATVQNLIIAPAVTLQVASKTENYAQPKAAESFKGGMTLLLPFEYQFNQDGPAVTLYNGITNQGPDRIAGTPQRGAFYRFNFTINPDGGYNMELLDPANNPLQLKVQKALVKAEAQSELTRKVAESVAKEGDFAKQEKEAEAERMAATGEQIEGGARLISGTVGTLGIIGQGIATGISLAAAGVSQIYKGIAADKKLDAAKIGVQAQRRGLEQESKANELDFQAKILKGSADFAFASHDSYVFIDKPSVPQIKEGQVDEDTLKVEDLINEQLSKIETEATPENVSSLVISAQNMLFLIKNYYPIRKAEIRERIWRNLENLYSTGKSVPAAQQELVDLLFLAYNNSFLTGMDASAPILRKTWINNIRRTANNALATPGKEFNLNNYFGEYITLGKLPQEGAGLVTFEAMGENDLLICFARTNDIPLRNSGEELYEVGLGCWQNSKHVIRAECLGKSVVEISTDDKPDTKLPAQEFTKYWVNLDKGQLSAGTGAPGKNTFISWKDPYPTPSIRYIMGSCWNTATTIKNLAILPAINLEKMAQTSGKKVLTARSKIGISIKKPSDAMELASIEAEIEADIAVEPEVVEEPATEVVVEPEAEVEPVATEATAEAEEAPVEDQAIEEIQPEQENSEVIEEISE